MVTVTDKISNATGPYIRKYVDDTVEANTLWETDQQVQFGSIAFFETLDSGIIWFGGVSPKVSWHYSGYFRQFKWKGMERGNV